MSENLTTNGANKNIMTQIDLMSFILDTVGQWQVHRCQVTDALISQHQPMKFIYHYEYLSDVAKLEHPLNGQLLACFDRLMTREQFAQLLGINANQVAKPWQIKFLGKMVVFHKDPEIALRLHWVNTIKAFEPIYVSSRVNESKNLSQAIDSAFSNWQIASIELIQKNPNIELVYSLSDSEQIQVIPSSSQFIALPTVFSQKLAEYLQSNTVLANKWLGLIKAEAQSYAEKNILSEI